MDVPEQLRNRTILIVDDVRSMQGDVRIMHDILKHIFQAQEFEHVLRASSEQEALRAISDKTIHLVLTDWIMPREAGLSFVKTIKEQRPELPIIMVTGMAAKEDVVEAMQAGVNDYILKPIVPKEVIQKAVAQLEQHNAPELMNKAEKHTDAA